MQDVHVFGQLALVRGVGDGIVDERFAVSHELATHRGVAAFAVDPVVVARLGAHMLGQAPDADQALAVGVGEKIFAFGPVRRDPWLGGPKRSLFMMERGDAHSSCGDMPKNDGCF